jgi:hypothetical protein
MGKTFKRYDKSGFERRPRTQSERRQQSAILNDMAYEDYGYKISGLQRLKRNLPADMDDDAFEWHD